MLLISQIFYKQKISKFIYLLIIISLNFNLTSCNLLSTSNLFNSKSPIAIATIADQKKHKPIYIKGKVIKLAPLLGNNAYQVQDSTGKIWVVTTEKLPSVGQNIFIKGNIQSQNSSSINQNLEELYLVELEQLENP